MKKTITVVSLFFIANYGISQKVYTESGASRVDVKVYVETVESRADLLVYRESVASRATGN